MFRRPLRLHSAPIPPAPTQQPPEMTLDAHGLPPAAWDRMAKSSQQGGRRALQRRIANGPVEFKNSGPPGAILIKRR